MPPSRRTAPRYTVTFYKHCSPEARARIERGLARIDAHPHRDPVHRPGALDRRPAASEIAAAAARVAEFLVETIDEAPAPAASPPAAPSALAPRPVMEECGERWSLMGGAAPHEPMSDGRCRFCDRRLEMPAPAPPAPVATSDRDLKPENVIPITARAGSTGSRPQPRRAPRPAPDDRIPMTAPVTTATTKLTLPKEAAASATTYAEALLEACGTIDPIKVLLETASYPKVVKAIDTVEFIVGWFHGAAEMAGVPIQELWAQVAPAPAPAKAARAKPARKAAAR